MTSVQKARLMGMWEIEVTHRVGITYTKIRPAELLWSTLFLSLDILFFLLIHNYRCVTTNITDYNNILLNTIQKSLVLAIIITAELYLHNEIYTLNLFTRFPNCFQVKFFKIQSKSKSSSCQSVTNFQNPISILQIFFQSSSVSYLIQSKIQLIYVFNSKSVFNNPNPIPVQNPAKANQYSKSLTHCLFIF